MFDLDSLACLITGRKFQFHATLKYTPDANNGQKNVTLIVTFGVTSRNSKTMLRDVKRLYGKCFFSKLPKYMLKNGKLEVSNISYLGFFK